MANAPAFHLMKRNVTQLSQKSITIKGAVDFLTKHQNESKEKTETKHNSTKAGAKMKTRHLKNHSSEQQLI